MFEDTGATAIVLWPSKSFVYVVGTLTSYIVVMLDILLADTQPLTVVVVCCALAAGLAISVAVRKRDQLNSSPSPQRQDLLRKDR